MKLRYLYALPILATALMGCDEIEYSDAKPVENPQLPGITQTDFSVTPSSALLNGINLDALNAQTDDPKTYMVELYKINVLTEALPESAELSGSIQFSMTQDFENPFNLTDIVTVDDVVSVPLSSLLYTRGTMISTKDPREYTIYYRIPVYVTLNGGQYKLGDKDFYYNDGDSFPETGVDPGYVVEEAYYLLGPDGTSVDSAVKFDHSGYNIYDDTIFKLSVAFSEGNTSWIVLPESVYEAAKASGSVDATKAYGPQDVSALTGVLELGGSAGTVEDGRKYDFTINLSTLEYTIEQAPLLSVGEPTGLYLPGGMNGWGFVPEYEFIATADENVYIMPYVVIDGGTEFKVANEGWGPINLGGDGTAIEPGVAYTLVAGDTNLKVNDKFVGSVIFTTTAGGYTLTLQPFETATAGEGSGIYLRGSLPGAEDWSAIADYEFKTSDYKNVWNLESQSINAGVEFKVADESWGAINFGANAEAGAFNENTGTGILGLVAGGANITLAENFNGNLRLVAVNGDYYLFFILEK